MDDDVDTFVGPPLSSGKFRYLTTGLDDIQGWLFPSTALYRRFR
ncbi:MAG: hypothetical protein WKF79_08065 [Nocardioides sp.]